MAKPKTLPQAAALEIQEDIFAWLGTRVGYQEVLFNQVRLFEKIHGAGVYPAQHVVDQMEGFMPEVLPREKGSIGSNSPTYCTADYGSLLLTMASSAPKDSLNVSDVAQSQGMLVFETPMTFEMPGDVPDIERVRVFSWYTLLEDTRRNVLNIYMRAWTETRRTQETPQIMSRHKLFPAPLALTGIGPGVEPVDHLMIRLLQSHFALLKSPMSSEEAAVRDPRGTPRTKRSLGDSIRRVYLRRPEVAQYEADEAAAAREGRAPMRAHWVRGHWRNQHYSTANENRWIWIEGFIKGNPENGTVSTRKVGVARASASELRELVSS